MARQANNSTEPLLFPSRKPSAIEPVELYHDVVRGFCGALECLLCDRAETDSRDVMLKHLVEDHCLVIADVQQIADLAAYLGHWKQRLTCDGVQLPDIASAIDTGAMPALDGIQGPIRYHLLSDILPEDRALRERLVHDRLERVLGVQRLERCDTQPWLCLFCKAPPHHARDQLFAHMLAQHQFNVGLPDNLVFVRQFLTQLQAVLDHCQCLYCEKTFPSHAVLRNHQRKKHHFKINPTNRTWDIFYLINYRELGGAWDPQHADAGSDDDDGPGLGADQWEDWDEHPEETQDTYCLFCQVSASDPHDTISHLADAHAFTLPGLDFYQRVKAVNYLRRQAHLLRCGFCDGVFDTKDCLTLHIESELHARLPDDTTLWDQPQFFFPTFENDPLLTALEDFNEMGENSQEAAAHVDEKD